MENSSVSKILDQTFRFYPQNESEILPGIYDVSPSDVTWILSSTLIFFTMHTGIALIEVGIVGEKNQLNVMMKNIVDFCAGGFGFWCFGFALMFGRGKFSNSLFGAGDFFVNPEVGDPLQGQVLAFYFFQMSFSTTAMTIVSGAVAERFKFSAYILFAFLFTFVYAIGSGWIWGTYGWLKILGVIDFAGAGPIHIIAGASAFTAAWFTGPRLNRYDNGTEPIPPKSMMTICVALFVLWWGWIGFNTGSSYGITNRKWELAARAGAGTTLASMSAGMTGIFLSSAKHKGKIEVFEVVSSVISGLVAINSGCFIFSMFSAVIVGAVAAVLCFFLGPLIDQIKVDDAAGATAVHLVNGIWGQLSVGLFADPPSGQKGIFIGGGPYQLFVQAISSIFLTLWAATTTFLILFVINKIVGVRLSEDDERAGCDSLLHFQGQNLIQITQTESLQTQKLGGDVDRFKPFYLNQTFESNEHL